MPTENKPFEPSFDLNTSEGGRGFIANLFVTVLRRHDFTTYIKERLAADFACTLSKFIACAQAREAELQLRMNAADQRIDELERALGGMLFAFDDGVGREWSADLLDFARKQATAVEFNPEAGERYHGIPGTSFQRLNMLANQGE
jgi:hypothetical protein